MMSKKLTNSLLYFFARKAKPIMKTAVSIINNHNEQLRQSQKSLVIQEDAQKEIQIKGQIYKEYEIKLKQRIKEQVVQELKFNPAYEGEDPTPSKLVNRPSKGAVWGLGGQLMMASRKIQLQGLKDDMEEIIQFLELNQVKNIYVHDFHKENPQRPTTNKRRYHLIGSCYSARHCWKTATQLRNAFNLHTGKSKLRKNKNYDPIYATRTGGKDEQFCMVEYKDFSVNLMTEEQRQAMDLQWKWNNQVPEETIDKYMKAKLNRKGRKNQFEDF